jgi:protein TonB
MYKKRKVMKAKKSRRCNLEKNRTIYFQTGIIIALALSIVAFEWSSVKKHDPVIYATNMDDFVEEYQPRVIEKEKKEILPPEPSLDIEMVSDDELLEEDPIFLDVEGGQDIAMPIKPYMEPEEEEVEDVPFVSVEHMPKFMGGDLTTFWKYIQGKIKYPEKAAEHGIKGTVTVSFVVNEKGEVQDVRVLRPVDPALDAEAIRAISNSPRWEAGRQGTKKVKVAFTLPIKFILQ